MEEKELVLEQGKIYYFDYGNNTQIIGRYKDSDACNGKCLLSVAAFGIQKFK